jgi:transposase InsO family protein
MVISVAPAKGRVGLSRRRLLPNADADLSSLIHPSDRGVQCVTIRYTERLVEAGAVGSVGSRGDGYDNALAKTVSGLYKSELIRRRGPWRTVHEVEPATGRLGRLVEQPAPPQRVRRRPAGRVRAGVLQSILGRVSGLKTNPASLYQT